jgi:hypothetical protein
MDKGAITVSNFVVSLLVFSAIVALGSLMVADLGTTYENEGIVDDNFEDNYNKLEENTEDVQLMYEKIKGKDGFNLLDVGEVLLTSTFSIVGIVLSSIVSFGDMLVSVPGDFGIPTQVTVIVLVLFTSIITVLIIINIINSVNKTSKL